MIKCPCEGESIPDMFIPKSVSQARVNAFIKKKYNLIIQTIDKYDVKSVFYYASDFTKMIDFFNVNLKAQGVRIYFASYSDEGSDQVPQNYGNLMTLIFAPTVLNADQHHVDIKKYYSIPPGGSFDETELDAAIAQEWVLNFQDNKLVALNPTVPGPNDTKSMCYYIMQLVRLNNEIRCQGASGVRIYFAAYDEKDYLGRLTLDLTLTDLIGNDHVDFYIEDRLGMENDCRTFPVYFDTGSPCPPSTVCNGASLGHP